MLKKSVSVVWKRSIEAVLLMPLWNFLTTLIEVFLESLFYSQKVK
ncbi:hypothetical protein LEP1GSC186_0568 [Leptospira noguchii serovar Autumnalis str. ZUN142]|uniref:Uncharacterized protein n=1 Tax=Leptospira noguchii serovar Autumnalis str. ZUN142 TaxID=1085540 RepID=M6U8E1_9LEPT|nr:hypothetical protein LEP1GSC186_0568 [Leptospira noguchii serovar Autumnalis str. ZUN142]